ncbi:hypothetical protein I7I53_00817 [Histoplasma capsulatum var. duboisii H88]|uniref:Uncharacterized protein n=1 Tax=Ajellomyces capsulatus (strain H88) TaxID=544711 RepID=A0A8A1LJ88_AJEC8|nr:hypothetical protein I7I53_00817 [Histoplasma capsulatum var. duboisii H88]
MTRRTDVEWQANGFRMPIKRNSSQYASFPNILRTGSITYLRILRNKEWITCEARYCLKYARNFFNTPNIPKIMMSFYGGCKRLKRICQNDGGRSAKGNL